MLPRQPRHGDHGGLYLISLCQLRLFREADAGERRCEEYAVGNVAARARSAAALEIIHYDTRVVL